MLQWVIAWWSHALQWVIAWWSHGWLCFSCVKYLVTPHPISLDFHGNTFLVFTIWSYSLVLFVFGKLGF
jgi:hypothetical protein